MKLTRGERYCLICFALVLIGFMPPVISWANGVEHTVLGCPFLLFYAIAAAEIVNFLLVAVTSRFTTGVDGARIERFEQLLAEED